MTEESRNDLSAVVEQHLIQALQAKDYDTAVQELQAALKHLESLEENARGDLEQTAWMDYSVIAEHFGDVPTAIEFAERLASRKPTDLYSHLALARLHSEMGHTEEASESLRKCDELASRVKDRKVLAVLAAKGQLPDREAERARRLDDAVAVYREALKDRSLKDSPERYAGTQQRLGDLYRVQADLLAGAARASKLEDAADAYREALKGYTPEASPDKHRTLLESLRQLEKFMHGEP